jgi:hypothetical protein
MNFAGRISFTRNRAFEMRYIISHDGSVQNQKKER